MTIDTDITTRIQKLSDDIVDLRAGMVEHRVRLENGVQVFSDVKKTIAEIDIRTTPKPVSLYKVISMTVTIVLAGAGALWGLANTMRDRPTLTQIQDIMHEHEEKGHSQTREDIRQMQVQQVEQRTLINELDRKLDTVLKHLDAPPTR